MPENAPEDLPEESNSSNSSNSENQGSPKKAEKGGLRGWWGGLSTPIKALLALAAGFILAGVLAVIITNSQESVIIPPEPEAVETPDESQQLPDGGSDSRVSGIRITPASQTIQGQTGDRIDPITIFNGSANPAKVIVNYVPAAGNTLTGAPVYGLSKRTIQAGKKEIIPDASTFQLAPGASRSVGGRIVGKPNNGLGLFGLMVFSVDDGEVAELGEPVGAGVNIRIKRLYRIASIVNVQFPGNVQENFELEQIRAIEEENGILFRARVRNTGNFITQAGGEITVISNATGEPVARINMPEQGALPKNARDLQTVDALQNLPPGDYTAQANIRSATRKASSNWAFRIDENGNLPTPAAEFALRAEPNSVLPGEGYSVQLQARNDGTRSFAAKGTISLFSSGTTDVIEEQEITLDEVGPGDLVSSTVDFPGIKETGNYELVAEIATTDGINLGQRVATVLVREEVDRATLSEEIRNWMSANPLATLVVGIGIVGLLMALALGVYLLLQRRKK